MSPAALKPLILKSMGLISLIGLINFPREANPGIAQPERPERPVQREEKGEKPSKPPQGARSFRPERKLAFQLRQAAGDLSLPSFLSFARKKADFCYNPATFT
jgi:hypothetical protein